MTRYLLASLASGILFVGMDVLINANPLAQRLHQGYAAIARKSMNPIPATLIDLAYGFIIAGLYLLLRPALPGSTVLAKAVSFALILWVLRVVMTAVTHWVMFDLPGSAHMHDIAAGFLEMLVISAACALILGPAR